MNLKDNPFYILEIRPQSTKREIMQAAEEKMLFDDPEKIENAKNILLDSRKRLEAELSWFPGATNDIVDIIVQNIEKIPKNSEIEPNYQQYWYGNLLLENMRKNIQLIS